MVEPDPMALSPAQFEQLVKQFFRPNNTPEVTASLQDQIQKAQTSSSWALPDALLQSDDQSVRFIGASTFMVKINQSASSLTDLEKIALLQRLVAWFMRLVDHKESLQVLIKICSTLATFFLLPDAPWTFCIRHILCCFHRHSINGDEFWVDEDTTKEPSNGAFPVTADLIASLSPKTRLMILVFTKILAEDANRMDHSSQNFNSSHRRVELNVVDAAAVMQFELDQILTSRDRDNTLAEVLECALAWMKYAREEISKSSNVAQPLRNLIEPIIKCLYFDNCFKDVAEFFISIFSGDVVALDTNNLAHICAFLISDPGLRHVSNLEAGEMEEDSLYFGQLVFHSGLVLSRRLMEPNPQFVAIMDIVHRLTRAQSYDSIDPGFSNACVEFWENYYSTTSDFDLDNQEDKANFKNAENHWTIAMDELLYAASLPLNSRGELEKVRSDDLFGEFRTQVYFAISASYMEFDILVFQRLATIVAEFFNRFKGSFSERFTLGFLEFTLYCISGLSDSVHSKAEASSAEDHLLKHIFESPIYRELTNLDVPCPEKVRRRAIALVGDHEVYFRTRQAELLSAFDFLFRTLEYLGFRDTAARSIYLLASKSRKLLAARVEEFLQVSERCLMSTELGSSTKERIIGTVGGIVREVNDKDARYDYLFRLCDLTRNSMELVPDSQVPSDGVADVRQMRAHETLIYLKALGKAFQAPETEVISLDEDDDEKNAQVEVPMKLRAVQTALLQFIDLILRPYPEDGPLLVAACEIFRTGFCELQPGPFTFGAQATANFITAVSVSNPCVDFAVRTAATFLHSKVSKEDGAAPAVEQLLVFVCNVTVKVATVQGDPDLSSACVEFFKAIIQRHENQIRNIPLETLHTVLSFSIYCLEGANYQPKKMAAEFWSAIFEMSKANHDLGAALTGAVGPSLTAALVNSFGGNAPRSELVLLSEPFRKMIFCERHSKQWIEEALFSTSFPSARVSDADKRQFLAQVAQLRGGKRTKDVVKDFWLACRGTLTGYN